MFSPPLIQNERVFSPPLLPRINYIRSKPNLKKLNIHLGITPWDNDNASLSVVSSNEDLDHDFKLMHLL